MVSSTGFASVDSTAFSLEFQSLVAAGSRRTDVPWGFLRQYLNGFEGRAGKRVNCAKHLKIIQNLES